MHRRTPLGTFFAGIVAGAAGAFTQALYFKLTKAIAPSPPSDAFDAPEPEQDTEMATQTVARRTVELLARRTLDDKDLGGEIVHYAFGALWGGVYGLVAGTFPRARTALGGAAFGALVWAVSDHLILPAFKLAGWPQAYPLPFHGYALGAHLVYGATLATTYGLVEEGVPPLVLLGASHWVTRNWPRFARPTARRLTHHALHLAWSARAMKGFVAQA
jgi:uncharacterized membrane protein YagU involved in acid resistance